MATTESAAPINGNYAQQGYDAVANNYAAANANSHIAQQAPASQPSSNNGTDIPKDEVGWYFVEQYYTTLSKSPEKLFLFYNKRSQFVSGNEEDKVPVCIGQKAINERIKELDFQDCKVRVTNVDSQGSDENIVIQVIGEISNKGQPHKRFTQTFVLAAQTNGYFVLNDIFRYLAEDAEEEEEQVQPEATGTTGGSHEPAPTAAVPEAEAVNHHETVTTEEEVAEVDHKLEDAVEKEPSIAGEDTPEDVNGEAAPETPEAPEVVEAEDAPVAAVPAAEEPSKEAEEPADEEAVEPEKPKDPAPTPAPAQKPAAPVATPSAAPKPAVPRTWASLVGSSNKVAMPNAPASATSQAAPQPKAAAPAQAQPTSTPPAQAPSAPAREPSPSTSQGESTGWQTAGAGHKKDQSRSQNVAGADADNRRAYIKNVYPQVDEAALRSALSKFGEIDYFDVSRQKNCAFVDFKNPAGFQNAVTNNPHHVSGVDLRVEERRMRPGQPPFQQGSFRGRGGPMGGQRGRGGFQRGGRGGNMGRGGRAAPQEA